MTEDQRREVQRARARAYHQRMKDDPDYRARKAAKSKAWREANPERQRAAKKKCYEAKREQYLAHNKAYREADPEAELRRQREWRRRNPEALQVQGNRRRARERGDLTAQDWLDVLDEFDRRCAYCQAVGVPLQQEHMTPLARGGRHMKSNVVPACARCNLRKGTKTIFEFAGVR